MADFHHEGPCCPVLLDLKGQLREASDAHSDFLIELDNALGGGEESRYSNPEAAESIYLDVVRAYKRELDAKRAAVGRLRAMPTEHPSGGYHMVSMRDVLAALNGTEATP